MAGTVARIVCWLASPIPASEQDVRTQGDSRMEGGSSYPRLYRMLPHPAYLGRLQDESGLSAGRSDVREGEREPGTKTYLPLHPPGYHGESPGHLLKLGGEVEALSL